jgi:uncharacterized protein (DUF433 family)
MLANGDSIEDLVSEYPFLTQADVLASWIMPTALVEEQLTRDRTR